jgi:formaldehyde-activating enzyme
MAERIGMRMAETLVAGASPGTGAEPEIVMGDLDGPVGYALANLNGNQAQGHTKVFALLNGDVMVRPATLMVSKVTVDNRRYTNILMGTVQGAIANGVLDAVRNGDIPKAMVNDIGIVYSVWLNPVILEQDPIDHQTLFDTHRKATTQVIQRAMNNEPDIDWLLENQDQITHKYFQMGLDGKV